jgi:glycosyltransferase involved in cell wall biosynthesis
MKISMPLVSIIIPVYKVEKYLDECIRSVIGQTYQNLEIILVDDGSPDRCGEICDRYAEEDSRVKVIHKSNGGLSDARNAGIAAANGTYLFFLDSDDYIRLDTIDCLVKEITQSSADIVCAAALSFIDGSVPSDVFSDGSAHCFTQDQAIVHYVQSDWSAWGKLYRWDVHKSVTFPVGKIHEDEAIMIDLLEKCIKICDIPEKLYYYRKREHSITSTVYTVRKMDWFYNWERNTEIIAERHPDAFEHCLAKAWMVTLYNIDNLIGSETNLRELSMLWEFVKKYKFAILRNRHIILSRKLRLAILLLSGQKNRNCLYTRIYRSKHRVRK